MNITYRRDDGTPRTTVEYWEARYQQRDQVWSGRPNQALVREIGSVTPGSALDLGCGEGADAIWLAQRGWQVTAADVSETALSRARVQAQRLGLSERIDWQRHDLAQSFPAGRFDLVTAHYLHSPAALDGGHTKLLPRAAEAVARDGLLLIVGHSAAPWNPDLSAEAQLPTCAEVRAGLNLAPSEWKVEIEEVVELEHTGHDGWSGTRTDNIVLLRRIGRGIP
ncbi:bifunctional 2-polyprenyl-6-hydroxyphenol methylase/3-demethylubiquinol 3-O-methyltransferase UbiG [Nocardia sp. CNY236]|uniref:class I SAM-dependent methyltransferase n=1 Tax=Nocardia sp. CNY236 TaxID=1169152 RepID=UPI0004104AEE|nr:class I SAM-dependent methyltransferase [Nocardia sp. CNY236]